MNDRQTPDAFLEAFPKPMRDIAERLRVIVRRIVPDAIEAVRPGWRLIGYDVPNGRRAASFAYVAPEPIHVHLGFEHGASMADPARRLKGAGITRRVRWLSFDRPGQLDEGDRAPRPRGCQGRPAEPRRARGPGARS